MGKRKQGRPQQVNPVDPRASGSGPQHGTVPAQQAEDDGGEKRLRMDEYEEFYGGAEFLEHQRTCGERQQVVVVQEGDGSHAPDQSAHGSSQAFDTGSPADPAADRLEESSVNAPDASGLDDDLEMAFHPSQDSNVILETMANTSVAVSQRSSRSASPAGSAASSSAASVSVASGSAASSPAASSTSPSSASPSGSAASSPASSASAALSDTLQVVMQVVEQLLSLQQQQMTFIEQVRSQVAMALPRGLEALRAPLRAQAGPLFRQMSVSTGVVLDDLVWHQLRQIRSAEHIRMNLSMMLPQSRRWVTDPLRVQAEHLSQQMCDTSADVLQDLVREQLQQIQSLELVRIHVVMMLPQDQQSALDWLKVQAEHLSQQLRATARMISRARRAEEVAVPGNPPPSAGVPASLPAARLPPLLPLDPPAPCSSRSCSRPPSQPFLGFPLGIPMTMDEPPVLETRPVLGHVPPPGSVALPPGVALPPFIPGFAPPKQRFFGRQAGLYPPGVRRHVEGNAQSLIDPSGCGCGPAPDQRPPCCAPYGAMMLPPPRPMLANGFEPRPPAARGPRCAAVASLAFSSRERASTSREQEAGRPFPNGSQYKHTAHERSPSG